MPRIRQIKPSFFSSESMGRLSDRARLLFIGLWTLADRKGRLSWAPGQAVGYVWPHDDDPPPWRPIFAELLSEGAVRVYVVEGHRYLWIPGFAEHQQPRADERASVLPEPPATDSDGSRDALVTDPARNPGGTHAEPERVWPLGDRVIGILGDRDPPISPPLGPTAPVAPQAGPPAPLAPSPPVHGDGTALFARPPPPRRKPKRPPQDIPLSDDELLVWTAYRAAHPLTRADRPPKAALALLRHALDLHTPVSDLVLLVEWQHTSDDRAAEYLRGEYPGLDTLLRQDKLDERLALAAAWEARGRKPKPAPQPREPMSLTEQLYGRQP